MADSRSWHESVASFAGAAASCTLAVLSARDYLSDRDVLPVLYVGVHAITACLFVVRRRQSLRPTSHLPDAIALLSLLSPYVYDASALDQSGPVIGGLLIAAALFLLVSTLSLGRSFGILPAVRGIRTTGAYRLVRHPIYMSYLLMDVAILAADPSRRNVAVFGVATALLLARIQFEEELLSTTEEYRQYKQSTRYRLLPFVF